VVLCGCLWTRVRTQVGSYYIRLVTVQRSWYLVGFVGVSIPRNASVRLGGHLEYSYDARQSGARSAAAAASIMYTPHTNTRVIVA
jgi:hypothetical protein